MSNSTRLIARGVLRGWSHLCLCEGSASNIQTPRNRSHTRRIIESTHTSEALLLPSTSATHHATAYLSKHFPPDEPRIFDLAPKRRESVDVTWSGDGLTDQWLLVVFWVDELIVLHGWGHRRAFNGVSRMEREEIKIFCLHACRLAVVSPTWRLPVHACSRRREKRRLHDCRLHL